MVDRRGRVLGGHQGVHRFTIGQRRGLGLALGRPVYVIAIDGRRATVVVGPEEDLMARGLWGRGLRWYAGPPIDGRYQVRVRYNHRGVDCRVSLVGDRVKVEFAEPLRAGAPGQLAVFARDHEIFGSAWIQRAIK
jgi:tRNA-specific 2-thiouridylase